MADMESGHAKLMEHALRQLPKAKIENLGTWLAENGPASDSAAHREAFFNALLVAIEDGSAFT